MFVENGYDRKRFEGTPKSFTLTQSVPSDPLSEMEQQKKPIVKLP